MLSGQHELLMGPDADLSVTSRPPGCKHTYILTLQHTHSLTKSVFVFVVFSEIMTDDCVLSPVTLSVAINKPSAG